MLGYQLRRWFYIKPTLSKCGVFAGILQSGVIPDDLIGVWSILYTIYIYIHRDGKDIENKHNVHQKIYILKLRIDL